MDRYHLLIKFGSVDGGVRFPFLLYDIYIVVWSFILLVHYVILVSSLDIETISVMFEWYPQKKKEELRFRVVHMMILFKKNAHISSIRLRCCITLILKCMALSHSTCLSGYSLTSSYRVAA